MERLTERLENGVINVKYASQHETAIHRLVTIEDILGEEYDLEQLRQLVQTTQTGRCKRCRYSRQPSRQTQLYGAPGTLTCRYGPCNRRNVNENDYCSYFAPKEESAP